MQSWNPAERELIRVCIRKRDVVPVIMAEHNVCCFRNGGDDPFPDNGAHRYLTGMRHMTMPEIAERHPRVDENSPLASHYHAREAPYPKGFGADHRNIHGSLLWRGDA
jgi:hypothetical protein